MTATAKKSRQIRLVPALVLASAVVVVSVAGSASAAKMITGQQIKNGSITTLDVRNNNLTGADLKNGTVAGTDVQDGALTGADLKDGSVAGTDLTDGSVTGADLADGSITSPEIADGSIHNDDILDGTIQGQDLSPEIRTRAVSNEAVAGVDLGTCASTNLANCDSYLELNLGAGTWMVSAALTMANDGNAASSASNRCALVNFTGLDNLHEVRYQLAPINVPGHLQSMALQSVVNVGETGTTMQIRCSEFANEDLVLVDANLAAVKVSTAI